MHASIRGDVPILTGSEYEVCLNVDLHNIIEALLFDFVYHNETSNLYIMSTKYQRYCTRTENLSSEQPHSMH